MASPDDLKAAARTYVYGDPLVDSMAEIAKFRRGPLQVAEPAGLLLRHGHGDRVLREVGHGVPEIIEQQGGHVLAYAQSDQNALYGYVGSSSGEGVGGYLPASRAQPVGYVEQSVAGVLAFADPPGDRRDAGSGVAVAEEFEWAELDDLHGEVLADRIRRVVDALVTLKAETEEVVVLGDDLAGWGGRS